MSSSGIPAASGLESAAPSILQSTQRRSAHHKFQAKDDDVHTYCIVNSRAGLRDSRQTPSVTATAESAAP
jgi:hypothetical protein